jgi:hypothetical protein
MSCFILHCLISNLQVANIYATFELRKFICNYFFRGKVMGILAVVVTGKRSITLIKNR